MEREWIEFGGTTYDWIVVLCGNDRIEGQGLGLCSTKFRLSLPLSSNLLNLK
jgi:hypothetical protein